MRYIIISTLLLPSLVFLLCSAKDIPNCNYEDTVDLTNAKQFPNGSYAYTNILIPPDQVGLYDYEELYQGKRVKVKPHQRGCVCKGRSCLRFCCHPTKEEPEMDTRGCTALGQEDHDNVPYVNMLFANGSQQKVPAMTDFIVVLGVPCTMDKTYSSMTTRWNVLENGSILIDEPKLMLNKRDYCLLSEVMPSGAMIWDPLYCEAAITDRAATSTNISMAVSIPFIIVTLMVYILIPELQNLHGKCFICYLIALASAWALVTVFNFVNAEIEGTTLCSAIGYLEYLLFMSIFFWLNVISFDLWQSFRRTVPIRSGQTQRFICYSVYAWGLPLLLTAAMIILDNSNVDMYYKPGMPTGCTIDNFKWPSVIYYTGINLAIVLIDIVFFSMTLYKIITMQRDIKRVMMKSDSKKNNNLKEDKHNFGMFFRLFLVMGITWLFDAASVIEVLITPNFHNPLYDVTDFLNAFVGPLTFICFILNRRTLGLIKKRLLCRRGRAYISQTDEETALNVTEEKSPIVS